MGINTVWRVYSVKVTLTFHSEKKLLLCTTCVTSLIKIDLTFLYIFLMIFSTSYCIV